MQPPSHSSQAIDVLRQADLHFSLRHWVQGLVLVLVLACTGGGVGAETASPTADSAGLKVRVSDLARGLKWVGVAVEDPDYTLWGAAPVLAEQQVHLFVARWPETNVDPAWRRSSEIAQYTADRPEGPFRFRRVVLQGTGNTGDWDAYAPHNPEVREVEGRFALLYIANSDFHQPPHPLNQQIGMLTAPTVNGPWTKVGKDGLLLGPSRDPAHFTYGRQVVNPALLRVGDRYHLYFKTSGRVAGTTVYGLAVADALEGPYRMLDEPLTSRGVTIEDATAFQWDGQVCLLTTDNHGKVTGLTGGGALWRSKDGVRFDPADVQLGFERIPRYFSGYDPARVTRVYGGHPKFERPKVLVVEGRPAYLYAPSGWNVTGGKRTVVHVLEVGLPPRAAGRRSAWRKGPPGARRGQGGGRRPASGSEAGRSELSGGIAPDRSVGRLTCQAGPG